MAAKRRGKREPPAPEPERLTPTWTAERLAVDTKTEQVAREHAEAMLGKPAVARTTWFGAPAVLDPFGLTGGAAVTPDDLTRAIRGRHTGTAEKVRKVTSIVPDVAPGQPREPGRGKRFEGVIQLRGTHDAPEAVNEQWRAAGAPEQEAIERDLIARTEIGTAVLTKSEAHAGAAVVEVDRSGGDPRLRVHWIAVGADRGDGIVAAYDRQALNPAAIQSVELATAPAEQAPPERQADPPAADVGHVQRPLRDSLTTYRGVLGDELTAEITEEAQELRISLGLPDMPEQSVWDLLPHQGPFDTLNHLRGRQASTNALNTWGSRYGTEAVYVVAVEEELISRACERYTAAAEREAERRGQPNANPIALVREARGDAGYADKVARRATILASHLQGRPEQQLASWTQATRLEIRARGGLENAKFETVAQATALQFNRNQDRERELAEARESSAAELGREGESAEMGAEAQGAAAEVAAIGM